MLFMLFVAARRLERNIKDVLDQIGDDKQRLQQLLTGKRVLLAEELSKSLEFIHIHG
jgi:regulator of replication initiation timing